MTKIYELRDSDLDAVSAGVIQAGNLVAVDVDALNNSLNQNDVDVAIPVVAQVSAAILGASGGQGVLFRGRQ